MTFFFLVIAVEARREFDMGELRQRSRLTLPLLAGIGGMIGPVAIYLAFNAGHSSARGWGVAMSTDTAFALGALALVGRRLAAEAAAAQGAFWPMHDLLLDYQGALTGRNLLDYAAQIGLDSERFKADMRAHTGAGHVAEDVDSADLSGVSGTPTFFVNGTRHHGAYDIDSLSSAVRSARARATLDATSAPRGAG